MASIPRRFNRWRKNLFIAILVIIICLAPQKQMKGLVKMILDIMKTKRQMRHSANPFIPGTWVVSMDIWYSSIAVVSPNKLFSIPLNVRKSKITDTDSIKPNEDLIRYRSPDWTIYDVGAKYSPNDKEYIPDCGYWEQVDMLRVLTETVLGISLLDNGVRTYSSETIRAVCCLPEEYEESSNFSMMSAMLEGHHTFGLLPSGATDWVDFDFAVKSAVIMPKSFANSYFDLYCDKTAYSDIVNSSPPMFRSSIGLYLHYCRHYS